MTTEELAVWLEGLAGDFDEVDLVSAERARCAAGRLRELEGAIQGFLVDLSKLNRGRGYVSGLVEGMVRSGMVVVGVEDLERIVEILE